MFFWGIILMIAGALSTLVTVLSNLDKFSGISYFGGFGPWVASFFAPQYLTGTKIAGLIGIVLVIVGLVLFIIGFIRQKKSGEADPTTTKSVKFLRDLKGEFRKITWPTLPATARNTGVTLVMCAILGVIICAIDLGLGQLIRLLVSLA